jgi:enamine deaminase RidA (YjgF/YER057c/UK114 family)
MSGTVEIDPATGEIPESAHDQTRLVFELIEGVLEKEQFSLEDAVTVRIYLTDATVLHDVIAVVGAKFRSIKPTNTTIICQLPVPGAKVQIKVTAR